MEKRQLLMPAAAALALIAAFAVFILMPNSAAPPAAPAGIAGAEGFHMIKEVEIGAPGIRYWDPEFDPVEKLAAFYIGTDKLYIGKIDPNTGRFTGHDYEFIGDTPSIVLTFNGAEFGYSKKGVGVYYTGLDRNGNPRMFRYRDGESVQLDPEGFGGMPYAIAYSFYPSKDREGESTSVLGILLRSDQLLSEYSSFLTSDQKPWAVFDEERPEEADTFTMASIGKGPRFVPGNTRQVITNLKDGGGVVQVARYDRGTGEMTQLTFDSGSKVSSQAFRAPELGDEMLIFSLMEGNKAVRIYRQDGDKWSRLYEMTAPDGAEFVNVQEFDFRGKSYILLEQDYSKARSTVNMISIDGKSNIEVSGNTLMRRYDPESLVSGDRLFIYYYDFFTGKLYLTAME